MRIIRELVTGCLVGGATVAGAVVTLLSVTLLKIQMIINLELIRKRKLMRLF